MLAPVFPLLLALVAETPATPAAPSSPTRVVVVATGKTPALDAVAAEAEHLGRQQVSATAGFMAVHATASSRTPSEVHEEARDLVAAGEEAYAELETKKAVSSLRRAISLLEKELDTLADRDLLVEALALLGSVHNQSGNGAAAERAFLKLLALSPTHALDEGAFPPGDVELLERLQEELAFTEPGTLEIRSGGVPAGVWLDGRYRGLTPLTLEDVEPGTHLWLVRRQGYEPASGAVVVEGKRASVRARLSAPKSDRELPGRVKRLVLERMNLHPTLFALADAIGKPEELVAVVAEEDPQKGPVLRLVRALAADAVLVGYREVELGEGWQERYGAALAELLAAPTTPDIPGAAVASADGEGAEGAGSGALLWAAGAAGGVVLTAAVVTAVVATLSLSNNGGARSGDPANDAHALARRRVVLGF